VTVCNPVEHPALLGNDRHAPGVAVEVSHEDQGFPAVEVEADHAMSPSHAWQVGDTEQCIVDGVSCPSRSP